MDTQACIAKLLNNAIGAIAATRAEIYAQHAYLFAGHKVLTTFALPMGVSCKVQVFRIGCRQESGLPRHYGGNRPALLIRAGQQRIGQQRKELPVLLRHEFAYRSRRRAGAGHCLRLQLAGMEEFGLDVHAASGIAERGMATKPGSFSIRASHARTAGYSSSAIPPSGACAT